MGISVCSTSDHNVQSGAPKTFLENEISQFQNVLKAKQFHNDHLLKKKKVSGLILNPVSKFIFSTLG